MFVDIFIYLNKEDESKTMKTCVVGYNFTFSSWYERLFAKLVICFQILEEYLLSFFVLIRVWL